MGITVTMGVTSVVRTAYLSRALEFTPDFSGVHVARSLVLCVMFWRSSFVLLSFFSFDHCVVCHSSIYGF
jgi:hypothetical protein